MEYENNSPSLSQVGGNKPEKQDVKGIAFSLQAAIEKERGIIENSGGATAEVRTLMMNPVRQKLLETLCRAPCIPLSRCARLLHLPLNNVKWHIRKMVAHGYVEIEYRHGVAFVLPKGILSRLDIETLSCINLRRNRDVLAVVAEQPGISAGELQKVVRVPPAVLKKITRMLNSHGLISTIRDGTFARFYSTGKLERMMKMWRKRLKIYKTDFIKRIVAEGLSPEIVRSDSEILIVNISAGRTRSTINLRFDFITDELLPVHRRIKI